MTTTANKQPYRWNEFLAKADTLYDYMIHNLESMIDGDRIPHFNIRAGICGIESAIAEITDYDISEIQKELIPWIRKELEDNQLFKRPFWKPFRDQELIIDMYLGYRSMFKYKQYYFQLGVKDSITPHFELSLYGWKNDDEEQLHPDSITVFPDLFLPAWYWEIK